LTANANVTYIHDQDYHYEASKEFPHGYVTFNVLLDAISYRRYTNTYYQPEGNKERGIPPKGWANS
jgi:hypothetical protein